MSYWRHIGRNVQLMRNRLGMTQAELGEKINSSKQFISNLENGSKKCSVEKLVEIAGALNCTLDISMTPRDA